ncbi:hypothetical protein HYQ46_000582 [Verticillium longisporum]|nr:hypothetical protein HYQ46_000582 [Verticillium longisporum]
MISTVAASVTTYEVATVTIAARQERVLTQTIRLSTTTFVSLLTLGVDSDDDTAGPPTNTMPAPDYDNSLSSAEIGGILGGIVAVVAIALFRYPYDPAKTSALCTSSTPPKASSAISCPKATTFHAGTTVTYI